jgi:integrase
VLRSGVEPVDLLVRCVGDQRDFGDSDFVGELPPCLDCVLGCLVAGGAVERELISRNPAKGRGRRVRERTPRRSYLETAAQVQALLDAAGELDREAHCDRRHIERRAAIATLVFAGLRIGELCELRWREVDIQGEWLHVGAAKTDAGTRQIKIRGTLKAELVRMHVGRSTPIPMASSFQRAPADDRARTTCARAWSVHQSSGRARTSKHTGFRRCRTKSHPHSLRRIFASILNAIGEDPGVMDEMGHTDPALALRVYRQSMRRGEDEKAALRRLVDDW